MTLTSTKHYTPEERRAWVRGVMEACVEFKATEDVTVEVCRELGIQAEELMELHYDGHGPEDADVFAVVVPMEEHKP
jgi:hypothetical protein